MMDEAPIKSTSLIDALREGQPDVSEREAQAVDFLIRCLPYVSPKLTNMSTGKSTISEINQWIKDTYGFTLTFTERKPMK